jgi:hypothetical protein
MLQVLYLNILKLDWVLHISPRILLPRLDVSFSFLDGDVRAAWARVGVDGMGEV